MISPNKTNFSSIGEVIVAVDKGRQLYFRGYLLMMSCSNDAYLVSEGDHTQCGIKKGIHEIVEYY